MAQKRISAFQDDGFQFNAFQIYDEATIDDGITTTIIAQKIITSEMTQNEVITTARSNNRQITA